MKALQLFFKRVYDLDAEVVVVVNRVPGIRMG